MPKQRNYTWKKLTDTQLLNVKAYLEEHNATLQHVSGSELWRFLLGDSIFIAYSKGTLFVNKLTIEMKKEIDHILGVTKDASDKSFLIGLDEVGRGEILGNLYIAGVLIPCELREEIDFELGSSDTKKKKSEKYWDNLYVAIDNYLKQGMRYEYAIIQPHEIDRYNLNKLLDQYYQLIISRLLLDINPYDCQIILDDYGYGHSLDEYFNYLKSQGANIITRSKADEEYPEVRLASAIAKRFREKSMTELRDSKKYIVDGHNIGSGNAADKDTLQWIRHWEASGKPWPWFVRQSFNPISRNFIKENPPLNKNLLSDISKEDFSKGKLSVESLSLQCIYCGKTIRSAKITQNSNGSSIIGRCPSCSNELPDMMKTLRYYSNYIIPDSSIIISKIISKDLNGSGFFKGVTFVLTTEITEECDKRQSGKQELGELGRFASIGTIKLKRFDTTGLNLPTNASKDEIIIETAKRIDAIIFTKDKGMFGIAISKGIFSLIW